MSTKNDIRYPYTHAADFIRCMAGHTAEGSKLSRSDASMIRQGVAVALGMPDEEVAKRLADCYLVLNMAYFAGITNVFTGSEILENNRNENGADHTTGDVSPDPALRDPRKPTGVQRRS